MDDGKIGADAEYMFRATLVSDSSEHITSLDRLNVNEPEPIPGSCTLTNAKWTSDSAGTNEISTATSGDTIYMFLEGTNCDGLSANFGIKEYDGLDSDEVKFNPSTFSGTFPSISWQAVWDENTDGLNKNPEYKFTGTIGAESERSSQLIVSLGSI